MNSLPYNVMTYSLSRAICKVGVPSMAIGLAAAAQELATLADGEGLPHFTWDEAALDKRGVAFLEALLMRLHEAVGESTHAR